LTGGRGRAGLIVDRDGTLTEERGHVTDPADLVVLPGVVASLSAARARGIPIVVVTNQSVVGRGLVGPDQLQRIHDRLAEMLPVDAIYHCPHRAIDGCACRKPSPALLEQAIADLDLDAGSTVFVGDQLSDCRAGRAAGVRPFLVTTGHGARDAPLARAQGFDVVDDLGTVVRHLTAGVLSP
jgi:histidinol-phosphate phosphatase family protein